MADEINNILNHKASHPPAASYLLFFISLAALGIGWWQIRTDIKLPFSIGQGVLPTNSLSDNLNDNDLALLGRDTDGDSLLDYDEVNVYNTSPYLADSDSDGYTDQAEIQSGHNPNCPANETCLVSPVLTAGSLSPQNTTELRALLEKSGVTKEQLDKIDDATLLSLYQDINQDALPAVNDSPGIIPNQPITSNSSPLTTEQKEAVSRMTASELRNFLKQAGAPADTIDQLDDATIKSLVNQALGI